MYDKEQSMSVQSSMSTSEEIIQFRYQEIKDISKQFLTLIAGALVVTVSFADKILPLDQALSFEKLF